MRPDDDLQLGMLVKRAGLRQRFITGTRHLKVEWYPNVRTAIKGLEKNVFAGLNYSLFMVVSAVIAQFLFFFFPFIGIWGFGLGQSLFYTASALLMAGLYVFYVRKITADSGYEAILLPFSVLLFIFILIRSTVLTLKQKGIYWRGTFYSLDELKNK